MVINNGFTINYTYSIGHDTTFTFPCAFTSTNYAVTPAIWIDGIQQTIVYRSVANVTLSCNARHYSPTGGLICIGY